MGIKQKLIHGFTIIELLIVIAIIGVLAGVIAVVYSGVQSSAHDTSVLSDLDTMDGLQTSYSLKHNGAPKPYYSGNGPDTELDFAASGDNVIDVVTNGDDYCIRGYNTSGTKNSIGNSFSKGSTDVACLILAASAQAGGSGVYAIGWWKLDGNVNDSIGNQNGTLNGAISIPGQNGQPGGAYSFDGNGQSVSIPAIHNSVTGAISFWFQVDSSQPAYTSWYVFSHPQAGDASRIYVNTNSDGSTIFLRMGDGTTIGTASISPNAWHHAVANWNGTSSSFFVDGNEVATATFNGLSSTGALSWFGCLGSTSSQCSKSSVDDIRVYSGPLSNSEVNAIYNAGAL